jgi:hypothetical protein
MDHFGGFSHGLFSFAFQNPSGRKEFCRASQSVAPVNQADTGRAGGQGQLAFWLPANRLTIISTIMRHVAPGRAFSPCATHTGPA